MQAIDTYVNDVLKENTATLETQLHAAVRGADEIASKRDQAENERTQLAQRLEAMSDERDAAVQLRDHAQKRLKIINDAYLVLEPST